MSDLFDFYPYAERFGVNRALPERGRPREEILAELREMATEEDAFWETGKCSGTMYCGDHEHYELPERGVRAVRARQNALQRDMCPSATKFEGEIIAMALDLMHADAVDRRRRPPAWSPAAAAAASCTPCSPTASTRASARGIDAARTSSSPRPAHPAFDKACHLLGIELRARARRPGDDARRPRRMAAEPIDDNTIAIVGSAVQLRLRHDRPDRGARPSSRSSAASGLHVDGCLGGFILPFGEELGYDIPPFDFRVPGVTTISADTHKYGYAFKGTSTLLFRDKALRNAQYFFLPDWSGGKYCSPGIEGSRSGGLLAATWAAMVSIGREGYRELRQADLRRPPTRCRTRCARTPSCGSWASRRSASASPPTSSTSTTSNDFMKRRGWRFNGQQYPNAIHMAVTRPQTQPGVVEAFAADLADAVGRLRARARRRAGHLERDLRRRAGRPQPRGRGVHPRRHDRHARHAAERPGRVNAARAAPSGSPSPSTWAAARSRSGGHAGRRDRRGGAQRDYETERLPGGGATQDAEAWWELVARAGGVGH